MPPRPRIVWIAVLTGLLLAPRTATQARAPLAPQAPPRPPRPPVSAQVSTIPSPTAASDLSLAPLKAVLLVGPIDGNDGDWTRSEIENMELAADALAAHGVEIHRFYPGDSNQAAIEAAADGAHFLLYRGHGVYDGNLPHPNVGGFSLSSGFYSSNDIRENLNLAPGAIVMLYGCFTAGSSSAEGDRYDIGINEASRRVAQYSDPFFDIGAGGYYANWFGDAFEHFVNYLFAGDTLGDAYEHYFDFNANTVYRTTHPNHAGLPMWVDKDNWGYWKYNNAFAGYADKTLEDLFPAAELGGIPASVSFTATVDSGVHLDPVDTTVTPENVTGDGTLSWTLMTTGGWFAVDRTSGTTPQSFTITPQTFDTDRPGTYTGAVTVTVTSPADTRHRVQRIDLALDIQAPALGGLPDAVRFVYSIADAGFLSGCRRTLTPQNTGSDTALDWSVTTDLAAVTLTPPLGTTPESFAIAATGLNTTTVASYSGVITVTVTNPASTYNAPQAIPVTVSVIDDPFATVYLPLVARAATAPSGADHEEDTNTRMAWTRRKARRRSPVPGTV